jgi:hypothetical protein
MIPVGRPNAVSHEFLHRLVVRRHFVETFALSLLMGSDRVPPDMPNWREKRIQRLLGGGRSLSPTAFSDRNSLINGKIPGIGSKARRSRLGKAGYLLRFWPNSLIQEQGIRGAKTGNSSCANSESCDHIRDPLSETLVDAALERSTGANGATNDYRRYAPSVTE